MKIHLTICLIALFLIISCGDNGSNDPANPIGPQPANSDPMTLVWDEGEWDNSKWE